MEKELLGFVNPSFMLSSPLMNNTAIAQVFHPLLKPVT